MQADSVRWRLLGPLVGLTLALGGCGHDYRSIEPVPPTDEELNVPPANYKTDILGAMHAYLIDPTGIRDSAISTPAVKPVGNSQRYIVCLRFNAKRGNSYAGVKEVAAVFVYGRFDRFVDTAHEACADAAYAPFPELGKLTR
ncbi:MAG TPA: hypothetical protein VNU65_08065 [Xanthobacteraceae bacterium]|jgi:hypothetical protein|nr:hypothetical protein [Xanthobacteraceae bacterium]